MRIHEIAKNINVTSKYVVQAYQNIAPELNIRSASSRVEITVDDRIFHESVARAAKREWAQDQVSFPLPV